VQLPWLLNNGQHAYSTTPQQRKHKQQGSKYGKKQWQRQDQEQTQQQSRSSGRRNKHHHDDDDYSHELSWPVSTVQSALHRNRMPSAPQQQSNKLQRSSTAWHSSSSSSSSSWDRQWSWPAKYTNAASINNSRLAKHIDSNAADGEGPLLPSILGLAGPTAVGSSSSSSSSGQLANVDISEGLLMARIRAAHSIADMEQLLLQFHAQFRCGSCSWRCCSARCNGQTAALCCSCHSKFSTLMYQ
jgi:hypothetical protein